MTTTTEQMAGDLIEVKLAEETIKATIVEETIVATPQLQQAAPIETVKAEVIEETILVNPEQQPVVRERPVYEYHWPANTIQPAGVQPYVTIVADQDNVMELHCEQFLAWVIDCSAIGFAGYFRLVVGGLAENCCTTVRILCKNVNWDGLSVQIVNVHGNVWMPPLRKNVVTEYELRSWDGGKTVLGRLIGHYPGGYL